MREMKDSGIDWLGMIPKNWDAKRLKKVLIERNEKNDPIKSENLLSLSIERGVFPYSEKTGGGNKAKEKFEDYKLAYENDIVLNSMNVIVGAVGLSKYFGCVSPVYYTLYSRSKDYNINYYSNLFLSSAFQKSLWGLGNGIVVKESDNGKLNTIRMRIPMEKLNNVILPIPPREEQEKIAKFLDSKIIEIDKVIEKTKETIEDYKKYKQAIITEAVTKGLKKNTEMKDSKNEWIGEIPREWNKRKLKTFSKNISKGATPSNMSKYCTDEYSVAFAKAESIENGIIDYDKVCYITENDNNILKRSQLQENDVLFVIAGSIGKCGIVKNIPVLTNINQAISFIRLKEEYLYIADYLKYYFECDYSKIYSALNTVKSALPNISMENLANMFITLPDDKEIIKNIIVYLNSKCLEIKRLIDNKEKIVEELEEYKKSLIYEYVTGKKEIV